MGRQISPLWPKADFERVLPEALAEEPELDAEDQALQRRLEAHSVRALLATAIAGSKTTLADAARLAADGDEKAKLLVGRVMLPLDQAGALLGYDDPDPDRARGLILRATDALTTLSAHVTVRERELWPKQAAKAEREDEARFQTLVAASPAIIKKRLHQRRELIRAAVRRYQRRLDVALLSYVRTGAHEVRPRQREGRSRHGNRSLPRRRP